MNRRPLDGVTILDLTRLLPGAYCTLLLADLGARVIKIEDPGSGDPIRAMTPIAGGESVYFQSLNRDKFSVTLNLRMPEARRVLDTLAARADALVESFRPRTARRLGVDAAALGARHPRLVHCSITGFGQDGPYADRAGHDINYVALAGLLAIDTPIPSSSAGLQPCAAPTPHVPRMFLADIGGGALSAVAGILAALFARERTGSGASVDISMHEGALAWLTFPAARALIQGGDVTPADLPIFNLEASYNIYRTADGRHVALGALEHKFWRRFCGRIGRPDLADRQFDTGEAQSALHREVAAIFATRSRHEWLEMFRDVDVCLSTVNTVAEALADPHAQAREVVARQGSRRFLLSPIRVDDPRQQPATVFPGARSPSSEPRVIRPAPALGADTDDLLAEAGLDASARGRLRAMGVI